VVELAHPSNLSYFEYKINRPEGRGIKPQAIKANIEIINPDISKVLIFEEELFCLFSFIKTPYYHLECLI
jgi:hypothetical protein